MPTVSCEAAPEGYSPTLSFSYFSRLDCSVRVFFGMPRPAGWDHSHGGTSGFRFHAVRAFAASRWVFLPWHRLHSHWRLSIVSCPPRAVLTMWSSSRLSSAPQCWHRWSSCRLAFARSCFQWVVEVRDGPLVHAMCCTSLPYLFVLLLSRWLLSLTGF